MNNTFRGFLDDEEEEERVIDMMGLGLNPPGADLYLLSAFNRLYHRGCRKTPSLRTAL